MRSRISRKKRESAPGRLWEECHMGPLHSVVGARCRSTGQFCQKQNTPVCNSLQQPVSLSSQQPFYQPPEMPLQGRERCMSQWCVCCKTDIPEEHKNLYIHLNHAHQMELLPGCPMTCNYFRSSWSDVKKHCQDQHNIDTNVHRGAGGCAWAWQYCTLPEASLPRPQCQQKTSALSTAVWHPRCPPTPGTQSSAAWVYCQGRVWRMLASQEGAQISQGQHQSQHRGQLSIQLPSIQHPWKAMLAQASQFPVVNSRSYSAIKPGGRPHTPQQPAWNNSMEVIFLWLYNYCVNYSVKYYAWGHMVVKI